ncbi:heme-binding domain-containing protein [Roseivirga sp. E12]|uniref:heme-binding domain-containing protein n=1 Tax=Roseivirga sp. E12 TaxID=2819237 RepID=UPI001ABCE7D7|nr:heme-binding domain-containing protein [Roseivirga sp. E12]MBO3698404.1 heme-binding domain-containing protein [Roseivirga sp. E12]
MKNLFKNSVALLVVILFSTAFVSKPSDTLEVIDQDSDGIEITGKVKEIIEAKCMGCHKPDARNEKAREKLQWVKVPDMNKEEQEHLIDELFEVLEEGKMPPKRIVERRPQMKLTDEETKILMAWVEKEEKKLKGE